MFTRPDSALYIERPRETALAERALSQGWNVFLTGARGSGRTTLLHFLIQDAVRGEKPYRVYLSSAAGVDHATEMLDRMLVSGADAPRKSEDVRSALDALAAVYAEIGRAPHQTRRVIAVDDVPGAIGNQVFGSLRDELWARDMQWVVSSSHRDAPELLQPPADAFFETSIELSPFSQEESVELLRRREPGISDVLLQKLARLADGEPRRLLELARSRADWAEEDSDVHYLEWQMVVRTLDRSERTVFDCVERLGGASASDPLLLRETTLSRPRVLSLLKTLQDMGLLTSHPLLDGSPGRPKNIFQAVSPSAFRRVPSRQDEEPG